MSTASQDIHPLIARLRDALAEDDFLTQAQVAEQIGVSTRTLSYWLNTDTTPQKRYRRPLAAWLDARDGAAA
jgi:hypothetical protein